MSELNPQGRVIAGMPQTLKGRVFRSIANSAGRSFSGQTPGQFVFFTPVAVRGWEQGYGNTVEISHGGGLVTDDPDSPHRLAGRVKASVYLAVADSDRGCTPEHQGALAAALAAADVEYCIELYRGKKHGFAVSDHPGAYDRDAAERHWRRLEAFLRETLGA